MKIGALTLFAPMHSNGTPIPGRVLAGWHWPKSITWRWGLDWTPGWRRPLVYYWGRLGRSWSAGLRLPLVGTLHFSVQQNLYPTRYPLAGYPLRHALKRRECIVKNESCPECGGMLDTGNECNECGFDAGAELKGLRLAEPCNGGGPV